MTEAMRPQPEEIVLYAKDPKTRIATITLNRPDALNAPTIAARLRFADLVHRANVDDEVKVLVIRGEGKHLGSGADLPEQSEMLSPNSDVSLLHEFRIPDDGSVKYPPNGSYRYLASITNLYANADYGCRSLQSFKKISILECKGYVYGWHFYLAADADIVVSADDALFGHAAFRYVGWGPRLWQWAEMMGPRKFAEMLFTGRPFTAAEMERCNFLNSVVPREALEAETAKYAHACSITRPNDVVTMQKTFFELYKQYRGEYFGSVLTGMVESLLPVVTNDAADDLTLGDETFDKGLNNAVKDNDSRYPADWRLSFGGRKKA
ncbi:MAG: enoyl-CoA hydratase/isomerase family protein [Sphingomonadales bacterium]|nr:enoyl-CoA hydratase/isomerase family protein [Sphingomonadales bacterium]